MKKKIIISLIILIILVGGFFYWWNYLKKTPPEEWVDKGVATEDFQLTHTENHLIVKEPKSNFSIKLPADWEKGEHSGLDVNLYSPEAKKVSNSTLIKEGCKISIGIMYARTDIETLKQQFREKFKSWPSMKSEEYKTIILNNKKALKHKGINTKLNVYFSSISIPSNNIYEVILQSSPSEKERCKKIFNQALKTLSID